MRYTASTHGCAISRISAVKDGLHVFGAPPNPEMCLRNGGSAPRPSGSHCSLPWTAGESHRVPASAPARGRRDMLPTGRDLLHSHPRMLPTPTAMDLGRLAADEVVRTCPKHGEMPRAFVIDLWGSAPCAPAAEIAQGLSLMGCRPTWDHATGRVVGIEGAARWAMGARAST